LRMWQAQKTREVRTTERRIRVKTFCRRVQYEAGANFKTAWFTRVYTNRRPSTVKINPTKYGSIR